MMIMSAKAYDLRGGDPDFLTQFNDEMSIACLCERVHYLLGCRAAPGTACWTTDAYKSLRDH